MFSGRNLLELTVETVSATPSEELFADPNR